MSIKNLLEIKNATLWRGSTRVFYNLSLDIKKNECVAILGPNGSGKTTLLKAINREIYPVQEKQSYIKILGQDNWNVWDLRKNIGVVSNDLHQNYYKSSTALEVVISGFHSSIGIHGNISTLITESQINLAKKKLSELGLEKLKNTPLSKMSTGQQRRCILARALVHEPKTLIFDEPTSGLDFAGCFNYLKHIRKLCQSGCNVIIVTHHLNEIPPEITRVILLKNGAIAADGEKFDILTSEILSQIYEIPIKVTNVNGHYLAYPD
ncbi:MAG: molybdenum ABC transporter ATP-binding protein [Woeseia sp.]|nr:molybdenum ABC transporter ATP-binding protein [Woeseia sp.]|tara:strand:- start:6955 stop:7749 length:795 start_codon:yes stop_codon:yes gene_type:complete